MNNLIYSGFVLFGAFTLIIEARRNYSVSAKHHPFAFYKILERLEAQHLCSPREWNFGFYVYSSLYLITYALLLSSTELFELIYNYNSAANLIGATNSSNVDLLDEYSLSTLDYGKPLFISGFIIAFYSIGATRNIELHMRTLAHRLAGVPRGVYQVLGRLQDPNFLFEITPITGPLMACFDEKLKASYNNDKAILDNIQRISELPLESLKTFNDSPPKGKEQYFYDICKALRVIDLLRPAITGGLRATHFPLLGRQELSRISNLLEDVIGKPDQQSQEDSTGSQTLHAQIDGFKEFSEANLEQLRDKAIEVANSARAVFAVYFICNNRTVMNVNQESSLHKVQCFADKGYKVEQNAFVGSLVISSIIALTIGFNVLQTFISNKNETDTKYYASEIQTVLNSAEIKTALNSAEIKTALNSAEIKNFINSDKIEKFINSAEIKTALNSDKIKKFINSDEIQTALKSDEIPDETQIFLNSDESQEILNSDEFQKYLNSHKIYKIKANYLSCADKFYKVCEQCSTEKLKLEYEQCNKAKDKGLENNKTNLKPVIFKQALFDNIIILLMVVAVVQLSIFEKEVQMDQNIWRHWNLQRIPFISLLSGAVIPAIVGVVAISVGYTIKLIWDANFNTTTSQIEFLFISNWKYFISYFVPSLVLSITVFVIIDKHIDWKFINTIIVACIGAIIYMLSVYFVPQSTIYFLPPIESTDLLISSYKIRDLIITSILPAIFIIFFAIFIELSESTTKKNKKEIKNKWKLAIKSMLIFFVTFLIFNSTVLHAESENKQKAQNKTPNPVDVELRIGVRKYAKPFSYYTTNSNELWSAAPPGVLANKGYSGYMTKICDAVINEMKLEKFPENMTVKFIPVDIDNLITKKNEITTATNKIAKAINEITKSTNEITKATNEMTKSTNETTKAKNETTKATNETTKATNETTKAKNEITIAINEITKSTNEIIKSTNEIIKSTNEITKSTNEITKSTNEITKSTNEITKSTNEITKSTNEITKATEKITEAINEITKATNGKSRLKYLGAEIDILCDPVTITNSRRHDYILSPPLFLSGIGLISIKVNNIQGECPDKPILGFVGGTTAVEEGLPNILKTKELKSYSKFLQDYLQTNNNQCNSIFTDTVLVKDYPNHQKAAEAFCNDEFSYYIGDREIITFNARDVKGCADKIIGAGETYTNDRYAIYGKFSYKSENININRDIQIARFFQILSQKVLINPSVLDSAFKNTFHKQPSQKLRFFYRNIRGPDINTIP